jgi:hypothetical protein
MQTFIGMDISKNHFKHAILNEEENVLQQGKVEMNRQGFTQFWKTYR